MALRRSGLPGEALSSSCDVFERAERHAQSVSTPKTNTSALLRGCVRRARIAASLTQEGAALDVGVHVGTLQRWERGESALDVQKLLDAPKMGPFFCREWDRVFGARRAA